MPRPKRRLIPVSEDLLEPLSHIARRMGISIQDLVEMILGQVLKIIAGREDIDTFLMESLIRSDMVSLGGLIIPSTLFIKLLENIDENTLNIFYRELENYARLAASIIKARGIDETMGLRILLRQWLAGVQATIEISEEDVNSNNYKLVIISPTLSSLKLIKTIAKMAVAITQGLGFNVKSAVEQPGIILIEYKKPENTKS